MKIVGKYRLYARAHRKWAAHEQRQDEKESLEAIAAAWETLAGQRQCNLGKDHRFRDSSGSLATLAAISRASSLPIILAADLRSASLS